MCASPPLFPLLFLLAHMLMAFERKAYYAWAHKFIDIHENWCLGKAMSGHLQERKIGVFEEVEKEWESEWVRKGVKKFFAQAKWQLDYGHYYRGKSMYVYMRCTYCVFLHCVQKLYLKEKVIVQWVKKNFLFHVLCWCNYCLWLLLLLWPVSCTNRKDVQCNVHVMCQKMFCVAKELVESERMRMSAGRVNGEKKRFIYGTFRCPRRQWRRCCSGR